MVDVKGTSSLDRAPRANYFGKSPGVLLSCPALSTEPIAVGDISTTGAKLLQVDTSEIVVGHEYGSFIHFRDHFISEVKIKVIYAKENCVGVEFVSPTDRFQRLIRAYFRAELAGASLSRETCNGPRWISQSGDDKVEAGFEAGKLAFFSVSLNSIGLHWHWRDGLSEDIPPDFPDTTLLNIVRNIQQISPEDRGMIESAIFNNSSHTSV